MSQAIIDRITIWALAIASALVQFQIHCINRDIRAVQVSFSERDIKILEFVDKLTQHSSFQLTETEVSQLKHLVRPARAGAF